MKPLIILTGPTAVGKTELSLKLAEAVGGEIISADSMQVYKKMNIGTAKITPEQTNGIKHYLIDCLTPEEDFNVVLFQKMAKEAMAKIYDAGHIPLIVGGTGFYIQSVLYDIDFSENEAPAGGGGASEKTEVSEKAGTSKEAENAEKTLSPAAPPPKAAPAERDIRAQLLKTAENQGADVLYDKLKQLDPEAAANIHPNNVKRVIRAIEYFYQTGQKISEHNKEQRQKQSPYNYAYFVLDDDRQLLYERIDRRVDEMFDAGLESEVKALIDSGLTKDNVSMQGIGYKEMFGYFDGEYDLERAKYLIKLDTRHFAKRQLTWFKRENGVCRLNLNDYGRSKDRLLSAMLDILKEKQIIQ